MVVGLGFVLLGVDAPEDVHAEEAVGAEGELDHQPQGDPVGAVAEDLVSFAAQDRVEEDATEGNLGTSFVAKGVVDNQVDPCAGDESSQ